MSLKPTNWNQCHNWAIKLVWKMMPDHKNRKFNRCKSEGTGLAATVTTIRQFGEHGKEWTPCICVVKAFMRWDVPQNEKPKNYTIVDHHGLFLTNFLLPPQFEIVKKPYFLNVHPYQLKQFLKTLWESTNLKRQTQIFPFLWESLIKNMSRRPKL